jgi:hypothetical protein
VHKDEIPCILFLYRFVDVPPDINRPSITGLAELVAAPTEMLVIWFEYTLFPVPAETAIALTTGAAVIIPVKLSAEKVFEYIWNGPVAPAEIPSIWVGDVEFEVSEIVFPVIVNADAPVWFAQIPLISVDELLIVIELLLIVPFA